jgi:hypothetical protein
LPSMIGQHMARPSLCQHKTLHMQHTGPVAWKGTRTSGLYKHAVGGSDSPRTQASQQHTKSNAIMPARSTHSVVLTCKHAPPAELRASVIHTSRSIWQQGS